MRASLTPWPAIVLSVLAAPLAWGQGTMPPLETTDLTGADRSVPADIEADVYLLIFGFERDQRVAIDSWIVAAERARSVVPRLDYYGVAVLPRGLRLLSGFIEGGLRDRYPKEEDRRHVLVAYADAAPIRRSLEVGPGTAVRAVLLDPRGAVLWWTSGPATPATEAELIAAAAAALRE